MLHAAPGELLDFAVVEAPDPPAAKPAPAPNPSKKVRKQQEAELEALRGRVQARLREGTVARRMIAPDPPPRYDEVFREGQAWLDALAGAPAEATRGTATFSDDIWKSRGRRDPGIP